MKYCKKCVMPDTRPGMEVETRNRVNIPLFKMYWDDTDIAFAKDSLTEGMNWSGGRAIAQFEQEISQYIGSKYCTVFNSGTSALHAMLLAYKIGPGDEVIVPSFTFISTANCVRMVGATPVFADIEDITYGLDAKSVNEKITKRTKAIILVHYGGYPAMHTENISKLAFDRDLLFFEDSAEAFGAKICDRNVGTFGHAAMLSFCQNKIITTGEGGSLVTNDKHKDDIFKSIRSHGIMNGRYELLGYNWRMPTICASIGLSQIRKADYLIYKRVSSAENYINRLDSIKDVMIASPPRKFLPVYQLFTIEVGSTKRNMLSNYLAIKGIGNKVYFNPVHSTPLYDSMDVHLPITEKISKRVLTLPMFVDLKEENIEYIVRCINEFF